MYYVRKLIVMIVACTCYWCASNSQTISNEVIASAGSELVLSDVSLEWTIGEIFIETYELDAEIQTLGFHQTYFKMARLEKSNLEDHVNVYPNPFTQTINIQSDKSLGNSTVQIINVLGEIVFIEKLELSKQATLDLSHLQNGFYYLRITAQSDFQVKILKRYK